MSPKHLMIVGAGGFGREMWQWASSHGDCGRAWGIRGFLDDNPEALDGLDYPCGVVGPITGHQPAPDAVYLCGLGQPKTKMLVCLPMVERGANFVTLIHPTAIVGRNVSLGRGTVVCPGAILTADIRIGEFVTLNCQTAVGHDATIGSWATLSSYCNVTGRAELGQAVFMGSHAVVLPGVKVGDRAVIGAGSVAIRSVKADQTVFGIPARVLV